MQSNQSEKEKGYLMDEWMDLFEFFEFRERGEEEEAVGFGLASLR